MALIGPEWKGVTRKFQRVRIMARDQRDKNAGGDARLYRKSP
jgi:hypothetical protein